MALTIFNQSNLQGKGNEAPTNLYYEKDRQTVINQQGAVTVGLINYTFQGNEITVFAAKDNNNQILNYLALPCPPYYHETNPAAFPGNVLV